MKENIRDTLYNLLRLKHLSNEETKEESKLQRRIREMEKCMPYKQLDNITKQIAEMLPAAEKRYGTDHPNYLFYVELLMVCVWCGRYIGLLEDIRTQLSNERILNSFLKEQLNQAEKMLRNYDAVEDIVMNGGLDVYMRGTLDRLSRSLPDHPRVVAFKAALAIIDQLTAEGDGKGEVTPKNPE